MKLAIISHTEHYKTDDGTIVGWSPTVNEINHLLEIFDEIYHVAMLYDGPSPPSTLAYSSDKIKFIPIKPAGGRSIFSKLNLLFQIPSVIKTVSSTLKEVDCFQLRTPTGIGVFLIPYLTLFNKTKGWFKYAGNWKQKNPPIGYALQRFILKQQRRKVTINGSWENQQKHCITFENPCLTINDLDLGQIAIDKKIINNKLSFCYVGRLEKEKGVERILKAFQILPSEYKSRVEEIHLVGNGTDYKYFESISNDSDLKFIFHGFLSRDKVFEIYKKSHVFLMPTTASEGFPKVIAEAMNFGCIPLVSNISSIGQYVKHNENGFLISPVTIENLVEHLKIVFQLSYEDYLQLVKSRKEVVEKFTFQYYNNRILKDIIN